LLVTCLLHLGGTFLVRVRFFERPSFVRVTSPNSNEDNSPGCGHGRGRNGGCEQVTGRGCGGRGCSGGQQSNEIPAQDCMHGQDEARTLRKSVILLWDSVC
jgi:hypothetical protein